MLYRVGKYILEVIVSFSIIGADLFLHDSANGSITGIVIVRTIIYFLTILRGRAMDITKRLRKRIEEVEGREEECYMLNGVPHIAVGHNVVSRPLADETLEYLGIEDESELMHVTLTDDQIDYLLDKDLEIAIADTEKLIGKDVFDGLSQERQEVLVDMSFNLGRPRFSKFKKLIAAVQAGDFEEAGAQILDSKAARDPLTKSRYEKLAREMVGEKEKYKPSAKKVLKESEPKQEESPAGYTQGTPESPDTPQSVIYKEVIVIQSQIATLEKKLDTVLNRIV